MEFEFFLERQNWGQRWGYSKPHPPDWHGGLAQAESEQFTCQRSLGQDRRLFPVLGLWYNQWVIYLRLAWATLTWTSLKMLRRACPWLRATKRRCPPSKEHWEEGLPHWHYHSYWHWCVPLTVTATAVVLHAGVSSQPYLPQITSLNSELRDLPP